MIIKKQYDIKDCAIYVLQYLLKIKQKIDVDINYLKSNINYGTDGVNVSTLIKWADNFGLKLEASKGDMEALKSLDKTEFPLVLLINKDGLQHYVILEKINNNIFYIQDSSEGKLVKINENDFKKMFLGIVIFINNQVKINKNVNYSLENKINKLLPDKSYVYYLLILAIINTFLLFGSTFFIKIVFDYIIPNFSNKLLLLIAIIFV
ncbi:UNVERIFIED_CONTAM: cysteine peptidase family C39 domain-containing protein [Campylobacter lari]